MKKEWFTDIPNHLKKYSKAIVIDFDDKERGTVLGCVGDDDTCSKWVKEFKRHHYQDNYTLIGYELGCVARGPIQDNESS